MVFFAYENWRANGHRTTLHLPACPSCNHGKVLAGGTRPDNGRWFKLDRATTLENATRQARIVSGAPKVNLCKKCLPQK